MTNPNAAHHQAVVYRLRAVIDSLPSEGPAPLNAGDTAPDFRTVSITPSEGEAIRKWVIAESATSTIEIGLAFGFSALHICEGLLLIGDSRAKHVVLDPFQSTAYHNRGLEILERAGVMPLVEFHSEKSQHALPRFLQEGRRFDFAFVDGNHRFDAVFVDLSYLGQLLGKGGIIFLDDFDLPGVQRAVAFFLKNPGWRIEETSAPQHRHHWVALRTSQAQDTRDFRHFVEFW